MIEQFPSEPIKLVVTRYGCPHCRRTRSSKQAASQHMERCWWNPDARSCKTCAFYVPPSGGCGEQRCNCWSDEECAAGVDLSQYDREGCVHRALPIGCPTWEAIW